MTRFSRLVDGSIVGLVGLHILGTMIAVWYSTVTVYVSIRGAVDIRDMLRRLKIASVAQLFPMRFHATFLA
jgi:hypothetical protein